MLNGFYSKCIYDCEMLETWYKLLAMRDSRLDIRAIIEHRFNVGKFEDAFSLMYSGQSEIVFLEWGGAADYEEEIDHVIQF